MESIDNLDIPEVKMMVTDHRRNFQLEAYLIYSAVIRDTECGRALVERLTADDRVMAHKGQMIARGSGATAFDVSVLAMWFIWCAKLTSEKKANELLENWLKVEESEILNTLWVVGLDLDATIQLDNGYAI